MFWLLLLTLTCSLTSVLIWLGPVHDDAAPSAAETPPAIASAPATDHAVPLLPHPPPVGIHPGPAPGSADSLARVSPSESGASAPRDVVPGIAAPIAAASGGHVVGAQTAVTQAGALGPVIARPDTALLEPAPHIPGGFLPHIARDGRTPMQVYAAKFAAQDQHPRVAILIAGVGMNVAESEAAVAKLPGAMSLAVSPYADRLDDVLDHARNAGHELLISLPMEPAGYPLNDPGHHALLTGASMSENAQRLEWAITRFNGFVGATGALGELRGERFAASLGQMGALFDTLAERGLLYVDPRPNARLIGGVRQSAIAYRGVDVVVDDVAANGAGAGAIDAALARLEKLAQGRGAAIGLVSRPSPLVVDRLGVWAVGLAGRGLALAPVSAVVQMPQAP